MSNTRNPIAVVYCTCPDITAAERLASTLVDERLAACVNLIPGVRSFFRWEGSVCDEAEVLLVVKTRQALVNALAERVTDLHPYDVPEVISLPVTGGLSDYLAWVAASTADDDA